MMNCRLPTKPWLAYLQLCLLLIPGSTFAQLDFNNCNGTNIQPSDCIDLVNIYNLSNGDNWFINDGWGTQANGNLWHGITLQPGTGRVERIELPFNRLNGRLPPTFNALDALQVLDLGNNWLDDVLPSNLHELAQLRELRLSNNDFNGTFEDNAAFPPWLASMTSLEVLDIKNNRYAGAFPPNLEALINLKELRLDNFNSAPFPDLQAMDQLEILDFSGGRLEGGIPPWIGELSTLLILDLRNSSLDGVLPESLGELGQLEQLRLGFNSFEGRIPASLGHLSNLQLLDIGSGPGGARWLTGPIPSSFTLLNNLIELDLFWQALSGPIPSGLGQLAKLRRINLAGNDLSGPLPESLTNLALEEFFVGVNFLQSNSDLELELSPAQSIWFDDVSDTVYEWPETGIILISFDSIEQRLSPFLFSDRFELR